MKEKKYNHHFKFLKSLLHDIFPQYRMKWPQMYIITRWTEPIIFIRLLLYFDNIVGHSFLLIELQSLQYIYKTCIGWLKLCSLLNLLISTSFRNQLLLLSICYYCTDVLLRDHPTCYVKFSLHEKCSNADFFLVRSKSPYSVQIQENTDHKKLRIWTLFTRFLNLKSPPNQFVLSFIFVTSTLKL